MIAYRSANGPCFWMPRSRRISVFSKHWCTYLLIEIPRLELLTFNNLNPTHVASKSSQVGTHLCICSPLPNRGVPTQIHSRYSSIDVGSNGTGKRRYLSYKHCSDPSGSSLHAPHALYRVLPGTGAPFSMRQSIHAVDYTSSQWIFAPRSSSFVELLQAHIVT